MVFKIDKVLDDFTPTPIELTCKTFTALVLLANKFANMYGVRKDAGL